LYGILKKII